MTLSNLFKNPEYFTQIPRGIIIDGDIAEISLSSKERKLQHSSENKNIFDDLTLAIDTKESLESICDKENKYTQSQLFISQNYLAKNYENIVLATSKEKYLLYDLISLNMITFENEILIPESNISKYTLSIV